MKILLVSNNLYENSVLYTDKKDLEKKKMTRPLSIEGEEIAKKISLLEIFKHTNVIYSSEYSGAIATAKYLSNRLNKQINIDERLNDCKIGELGNKSLKMVSFMQEHDFDIKLNNGESLTEVGNRLKSIVQNLLYTNLEKVALFTHRRSILGYLILVAKTGYNLDDNLVVEYNENVIYDDSFKDADVIELDFDGRDLSDIKVVDIEWKKR